MYKNFKITDEERNSIREQHMNAVKKEFNKTNLNEAEGELNNPYWMKIKGSLESMGFKFSEHNEKGSIHDYLYSGKNPFKNYQHGTLEKGNIIVMYPYTEVEGGPIYKDIIRVLLQFGYDRPDISKIDSMIFTKYKNSILKPSTPEGGGLSYQGDYKLKVADVNSVLGVVNDLLKLK
jgi:hypothetical protein